MANGLLFDGINDYVSIPSFAPATADFSIELTFEFTGANTPIVGAGLADSSNWVFAYADGSIQWRLGASNGGRSPVVLTSGQVHAFKIERVGGVGSVSIDGTSVPILAFNDLSSISFTVIGAYSGSAYAPFTCQSLSDWSTSGDVRQYDFNQTSGNVLPNSLGAEGTLINFPTDDTQWVSVGGGTVDALLADNVKSIASVSSPAIGQTHALLANGVKSSASVSSPSLSISGIDVLLADNVKSQATVSAPTIGQTHTLLSDGVKSAPKVSSPSLSTSGTDNLFADNVKSQATLSSPSIGQAHVLTADGVKAQGTVESVLIGQIHVLLSNGVKSQPTVRMLSNTSYAYIELNTQITANTVQAQTTIADNSALLPTAISDKLDLSTPIADSNVQALTVIADQPIFLNSRIQT